MFERFDEVLTVEELCEALKIGKTKACAMLKNKEISAVQNGRKWLIPRESVEKFIRNKSL